ncbi:hypothetical protein GCM10011514_34120 [Emticicia aquatilis]|uniref:Aminoglycoside phosphotransferase domain-containing protein n=1 Tax=Emticicia aquatilis TaxID=1537369 RepID=A0A916YYK0_9BACT|nr:phosphotransferase [Emticicia aquatilis]GGD67239.1 hypothetical protein GCM10011514_34120 [Emticicia aquatilis]
MILTLQNVIYYLYSNGFIDEGRIFDNLVEARQEESLNSTFLIRFRNENGNTINDGRVVKQAYKIAEEQKLALKKDAYLTCIFEEKLILNSSQNCIETLKTSIDEEKLIYVRKYVNGDNFFTVLKDIQQKTGKNKSLNFNSVADRIFSKINEVHNYAEKNIPVSGLNLAFPISVPEPKVSSSLIQQFWLIIGEPFKQFINEEYKKWGKETGYKVLIHGDFSLSNIVYTEGELYFLDYEFAQFGNPLWDYAWLISDVEYSFPSQEFQEFNEILKSKIVTSDSDKSLLEKYILLAKLKRILRSVTEGSFDDNKAQKVSNLNIAFEEL